MLARPTPKPVPEPLNWFTLSKSIPLPSSAMVKVNVLFPAGTNLCVIRVGMAMDIDQAFLQRPKHHEPCRVGKRV